MVNKKINYDYLQVYKEIPLLLKGNLLREDPHPKNHLTLIVNPCLIGDFVVSLPSIRYFIKKNKGEIDMMVSPMVKELAKRIKGVRKVFVARSIYSRPLEGEKDLIEELNEYDQLIILRLSKDSYEKIKNIKAKKIKTAFFPLLKYSGNIFGSMIAKKTPKQLRDVNFEVFEENNKFVTFEDIFKFNSKDYDRITNLEATHTNKELILIHTESGWSMNKWSNLKWINLIKRINATGNYRFIFVGAGEDKDFKLISNKLDFKVYSLINKITLVDLLLLMRQSDYFIGVDSGPRNMAHLADLRSIGLLGAGPHLYMPNNNKDIIIDKSNGGGLYQRYFYSKKRLINTISVDEVYAGFNKLKHSKRSTHRKK